MPVPPRVIAIDWSGAVAGERNKIFLAEADDSGLIRLENGRSREQVTAHLVDLQRAGERAVVGLDFAFSLAAWYLREQGWAGAPDCWRAMASGMAERVLAPPPIGCTPPFWGKLGTQRPADIEHLRRTERGCGAKSVFQINGGGAVGAGSLRGMIALDTLHRAGAAIWPFAGADSEGLTVMEIYPRVLTGLVNKSSPEARSGYLERRFVGRLGRFADLAASGEDAFDAAVSALVMHEHRDHLVELRAAADEEIRLEGAIWHPQSIDGSEPTPPPT